MTAKRFTSWGNRIKRNGKLLNIEFKTKTDAKLCCKLCNQMDKHQQEYIDELNEIFKWYTDYYGETILDTRMGWNDDNKISKLEKENEQLKDALNQRTDQCDKYYKENEQLKQFQEKVASVIEGKMGDNVCNDYKMEVLKEIWNELELDEVWFE